MIPSVTQIIESNMARIKYYFENSSGTSKTAMSNWAENQSNGRRFRNYFSCLQHVESISLRFRHEILDFHNVLKRNLYVMSVCDLT